MGLNLTLDEIKMVMTVLDAGVKGAGIQAFIGGHLQSALDKLQAEAELLQGNMENENGATDVDG